MAARDEDDSYWIELMRGPKDSPTSSYQQHLARIDRLVELWHGGKISINEKRVAVSDENRQFYGPNCPRKLMWP